MTDVVPTCTHPHVFRISTKDVYHCLACGEPMMVIPYQHITSDSTMYDIKVRPAK